jgi:hypothetical protein
MADLPGSVLGRLATWVATAMPSVVARVPALIGLPAEQAQDLAWWIAAAVAQEAGQADDPDVAATLAARALTEQARWRARRSQLHGGEHPWLWQTLCRATNPDQAGRRGAG